MNKRLQAYLILIIKIIATTCSPSLYLFRTALFETLVLDYLLRSIDQKSFRRRHKILVIFYDSFEQSRRILKICVIQGDTAVEVRLIEETKCTLANRINPDQTSYLTDDQNDKQLTHHVIE